MVAKTYMIEYAPRGQKKSAIDRALHGFMRGVLYFAFSLIFMQGPLAFSKDTDVAKKSPHVEANVSAELGKILDDYAVTRWQTQDGLPEDSVSTVIVSKDGYLWALTPHYLLRFDGMKFEKIELPETEDNLGWDGITETGGRTLWIYGKAGAYFYSTNAREQGLWTRLPLPQKTPVLNILQQDRTNIFAVVSNGLYQADLPKPRFIGLPKNLDLGKASIKAAVCSPKGPIWLIAGQAVLSFNTETFAVEYQLDGPGECISIDRGSMLWVATSSKLFLCKRGTWLPIPLPSAPDRPQWQITGLRAVSGEQIWVGTTSGLYRRFNNRWSELTPRDGFYPLKIQCIQRRDEDGNVWTGTTAGLVRLRPRVVRVYDSGLGLLKDTFTAVLPDPEVGLFVGVTGGGLLEGRQGVFRPVTDIPISRTAVVSALLKSKDGALWIGTQGDYLWRCHEGVNERITELPGEKNSAVNINALLADRQSRIFVGTGNGMMILNTERKCLEPFRPDKLNSSVHTLLEDHNGNIWVGLHEKGLAVISPDGKVEQFSSEQGLPSNTVLSLCLDQNLVLWAGTSDGLACWDGKQWRSVTRRQGLFEGPVSQIIAEENNLWLGTRYGIALLSLSDLRHVIEERKTAITAKFFEKSEGMRDEKCSSGFGNLVAKDEQGKVWFCTLDGLVMIDPKRVNEKSAHKCQAYIDDVKAGERALRPLRDNLLHTSFNVTVPAGAGPLSIHFSAPIFSAVEQVQFKMMLEGLDSTWTDPTFQRSVVYPSLAPGTYHFRLMAGWGGVWRESPQTVTIEIKPFLWQRPGFWLLCGLMAMILVGFLARTLEKRRSRRQLLEMEQAQTLERERVRIAHDLHDDLGASLTEIGLLSAVAQRPSVAPERAKQYLEDITSKVRRVVEVLDEIVWAVNPANDSVKSLGEYFCEYGQRLLQLTPIRCRLELAPDLPSYPLDADRRHNTFLTFNEALNNIIRHSGATEAVIRIAMENGQILVSIADNGRGFEVNPAVPSSGEGLKSMKRRMEKIGGTFSVNSQVGQGTIICLAIPVK